MSLMSDGSAFQARGPAMEKALLVTRSRVCETFLNVYNIGFLSVTTSFVRFFEPPGYRYTECGKKVYIAT